MNTTLLKHHGILGMHWGIRRYQNKDGTLTEAGKRKRRKEFDEHMHADYVKAHGKSKVSSMSDQELRSRINRLQMEQQYKMLSAKKQRAGSKFVKDVMREAAKNTASRYASKYMSKGIDYAISAWKK